MTSLAVSAKFARAARSAWQRVTAAWASASPTERATTVLLGIMIVGGIVLRIRAIWYPQDFTFDEPFFVPNAHNYLVGIKDSNDHPPLFKMFMSVGILLFGYNSAGWRFPALCFGILSMLLAYWLGKAYFRTARAGLMAAAFVAADGFFISYSRVGLMDGVLTSLLLWCMLAAVSARTWRGVLVTALLAGIAVSVKWSGVFIVIPAAVTMLLLGRVQFWSLLIFAVVPVVQTAVWLLALRLSHEPADFVSLWRLVRELVLHHVDMNRSTNPLNSSWYTWPIFYRPVIIKNTTHGVFRFYSSTVGNPVFWIAFDLFLVWSFIQLVARATAGGGGLRARLARLRDFLVGKPVGRPILLMLLGWAALLAPWTIIRNKFSFTHYYLPSYGFALLMLGGLVAHAERKWPRTVLVFVGLALLVAIYLAPVWGEFSIREHTVKRLLIPPTWRP
jgi:dolichyl-phosphate-mannose--protein O-mannosyl transferase